MQSIGSAIASTGVRDLSTVMWFKSPISWKKQIHSSRVAEGSSWSHSKACGHRRCIPIFARTRKAAANPTGSNIRAIWLRTVLFVRVMSLGGLTLKTSISLAWFQTVPSIFSCVAPCSNFITGFSCPTISFSKDWFESHPGPWLEIHFSVILHPDQLSVTWLNGMDWITNVVHVGIVLQYLGSFGIQTLCLVCGFSQSYLCHSRCGLISKRRHRLYINIRLLISLHVSPQVSVNLLILLGDKNPVIHFWNVSGYGYFILS